MLSLFLTSKLIQFNSIEARLISVGYAIICCAVGLLVTNAREIEMNLSIKSSVLEQE